MAIPHDDVIQIELLRVLSTAPEGAMHCQGVYAALAPRFPSLIHDEVAYAFSNSMSKFANLVQRARQHLVDKGWVHPPHLGGGRATWTITAAGRKRLHLMDTLADEVLSELSA